MRPSNAPRYKYTGADMDRAKYVAEINYRLVMDRQWFKSLSEIEDYIKELNK